MRRPFVVIALLASVGLLALGGVARAMEEPLPAPEDVRFTKRDSTLVSTGGIGQPFWMLQAQCAGVYGAASTWGADNGKRADAERDKNHGVAFYNGAVARLQADRKIDRPAAEEIAQWRMEYGRAYARELMATSGVTAQRKMKIQRSFCLDVEDAARRHGY